MKTYAEIISQITTPYSRGVASKSSRLRKRYVISILNKKRSTVLKNYYQRKMDMLSPTTKQKLNCIKLIDAPISECPCIPEEIQCRILKSEYKIPELINAKAIFSVTSIDGFIDFSRTTFRNAKHIKNNRFSFLQKKPQYYFSNGHIYIITDNKLLEYISIEGLFENPLDIVKLNNKCNGISIGCYNPYEEEFPLENHLIDSVIAMALEEIFRSWQYGVEDKLNNEETPRQNNQSS